MSPPRALVSYSHDSDPHDAEVLRFVFELRNQGIDALFDRFFPAPPQGWPRWMADQIEQAQFILAICTPTYRRRFEGHEEPGRGLGANLEGLLATQDLYDASMRNHKVIPVLFSGQPKDAIPRILKPYTHYVLPGGFDALVRHIHNEPEIVAPPVRGRSTSSTAAPASRTLPNLQVVSAGSKGAPTDVQQNMTGKSASSKPQTRVSLFLE